MTDRHFYEFKKFKSGSRKGKEYINIRSIKTGKVIRSVSSAKKLKSVYKNIEVQEVRKTDLEIQHSIQEIAKKYGANPEYVKKQYEKELEISIEKEKQRVKELRKKGEKPHGRKRKTLKTDIIKNFERTAGYVVTWRLFWVVSEYGQSPFIEAQGAGSYEGNDTDDAIEEVDLWSLPIINRDRRDPDYEIVEGSGSGACVRVIDRERGKTIDRYQLGVGCKR